MIERKNIIKLLSERTKNNVYHSAILTCFNFDPIFFESVYLPSLRSLGITNVVVMMDASMYDNMLADASYICHRVSPINYTLVRQENTHHGVFHPKMVLLFGEEEGVIIIGSGNLTFSGLSNNEEVWNAFHVVGNSSIHYPLLYKAWRYVQDALKETSGLVKKQLGWIIEQSSWLQDENTANVVTLKTGEECSLLYNNQETRILDQLTESIGEADVNEITVIAPFYDTEGNALVELQKRFNPVKMNCVLDLNRQSAPFALLKSNTDITFFKHSAANPLHAKIIEFQSDKGTWLLSGSANAGNMALGMNDSVYNDEACILLHSNKRNNYISDLGIQFSELKEDERKGIERPTTPASKPSNILIALTACEEQEGKVYMHFSKNDIKGIATFYDKNQKVIHEEGIVSRETVVLTMEESVLNQCHMAVLLDNGVSISNRCLVIKELNVESCNPDPKRRKLSSLLDDAALLQNLSRILGYIEFDEEDKQNRSIKLSAKTSSSNEKEDVTVVKERFNELKDSSLSITMHSGVRILAYLQQILFKKEDTEKSDDDLLEIDKVENGAEDNNTYERKLNEVSSSVDDAYKMRSEIAYFLKKMQQHLMELTSDPDIYGDVNKAVNRPKLMAEPGLNAASAFAVASRSVLVMMNKYASNVVKSFEIRELLVNCAGLFFSVYGNCVPNDDSNRSKKTKELIKDASIDLLTALSFFDFGYKSVTLPLIVLNCLNIWRGTAVLEEIIDLFQSQLKKLSQDEIIRRTVNRILDVAKVFMTGEIPINDFCLDHDIIYLYRNGYGFLRVDNIKMENSNIRYHYRGYWFEDQLSINSKSYRGFHDL